MLAGPRHRGVDVVVGCRCRMLRRQPIVDGNHYCADSLRHRSTEFVVTVQIAEHETAPVSEDHERNVVRGSMRTKDANCQISTGTVDYVILD